MSPEILAETMDGNTVQWMKRIATEKKIILTGSIIIDDGGSYYNRLIWMLPNGQSATTTKDIYSVMQRKMIITHQETKG
jgi:predicted amidohydrolase